MDFLETSNRASFQNPSDRIMVMYPMTSDQFDLVYNGLSFSLAAMIASTIFFWLRLSSVAEQYKSAMTITGTVLPPPPTHHPDERPRRSLPVRTGLVTFIAAYHYIRIFNSWVDAYEFPASTDGAIGNPDPHITHPSIGCMHLPLARTHAHITHAHSLLTRSSETLGTPLISPPKTGFAFGVRATRGFAAAPLTSKMNSRKTMFCFLCDRFFSVTFFLFFSRSNYRKLRVDEYTVQLYGKLQIPGSVSSTRCAGRARKVNGGACPTNQSDAYSLEPAGLGAQRAEPDAVCQGAQDPRGNGRRGTHGAELDRARLLQFVTKLSAHVC